MCRSTLTAGFRRGLSFAIACLGVLSIAGLVPSPARAAEVLVPFDAAGRITVVRAERAQAAGLFVDRWPGFREARLFADSDTSFVLEITLIRGSQLVREREPLTPAAAEALRRDVTAKLSTTEPPPESDANDGRSFFVSGMAALGLGFYGWAIPVSMGANTNTTGSWYLVSAGGSFFVPMAISYAVPVTYGMANLSLYGASRGILHGALLHQLLSGNSGTIEQTTGAMVTMSLAEGAAGFAIARAANVDAGTSNAIAMGGDTGILWGYMADLAARSPGTPTGTKQNETQAMTVLVASGAGLIAGGALAAHRDYSYGDVGVMRTCGEVGALAGLASAAAGNPRDDRPYAIGAILGSAIGLAIGDRLVAGHEYTTGQGVISAVGAGSGALIGLGFASLPVNGTHNATLWFGTALGAAIGYGVTVSSMSGEAAARANGETSWRFEVAPEGVAAALTPAGAGSRANGTVVTAPALARVRVTF